MLRAGAVLVLESERMATSSFASVCVVGSLSVMVALAHSSMPVALEIIGSTAKLSSLSSDPTMTIQRCIMQTASMVTEMGMAMAMMVIAMGMVMVMAMVRLAPMLKRSTSLTSQTRCLLAQISSAQDACLCSVTRVLCPPTNDIARC